VNSFETKTICKSSGPTEDRRAPSTSTHWTLTRRRSGHRQLSSGLDSLGTCAAEADPQFTPMPFAAETEEKNQAPIRPNRSVIFVEGISSRTPTHFEQLLAAYCRNLGSSIKARNQKPIEHNENTHRGRRGGRAHGRVAPGSRLRSQHIHSGWSLSSDDGRR
jgi:hypothetical protein